MWLIVRRKRLFEIAYLTAIDEISVSKCFRFITIVTHMIIVLWSWFLCFFIFSFSCRGRERKDTNTTLEFVVCINSAHDFYQISTTLYTNIRESTENTHYISVFSFFSLFYIYSILINKNVCEWIWMCIYGLKYNFNSVYKYIYVRVIHTNILVSAYLDAKRSMHLKLKWTNLWTYCFVVPASWFIFVFVVVFSFYVFLFFRVQFQVNVLFILPRITSYECGLFFERVLCAPEPNLENSSMYTHKVLCVRSTQRANNHWLWFFEMWFGVMWWNYLVKIRRKRRIEELKKRKDVAEKWNNVLLLFLLK